jgi:CTP synthase
MVFSGTSQNNALVEIIELNDHPWFVAVQYHPEFKSKPTHPHPLFYGLIAAAKRRHDGKEKPAVPQANEDALSPPYSSIDSD